MLSGPGALVTHPACRFASEPPADAYECTGAISGYGRSADLAAVLYAGAWIGVTSSRSTSAMRSRTEPYRAE